MFERNTKTGWLNRFLLWIEQKGNKIPEPTTLFVALAIIVVILSAIMANNGSSVSIQVVEPETQKLKTIEVYAKSLLSTEGIHFMLEKSVTNFTGFAPVGIVLVTLFGISAADGTGLLGALVRKLLYGVREKWIIPVIIFTGVMSNIASDAGYVMVLPLAGMIFAALGKNPLIGIAAGFFGVSAGFSANLLIGSIDPLLGNLSSAGAQTISPGYIVSPMANYYFMFISTFLLVIVGTLVNKKFIEPRLAVSNFEKNEDIKMNPITDKENRGLKFAFITLIVIIILILISTVPKNGLLRNPSSGKILPTSPFINAIVIIITMLFFFTGVAYGIGAETIKNDRDLLASMEPMINTMGSYLLLTFVASQFVAYFAYSNIGTILAVKGAEFLKNTGLNGIPLLVVFIFLSAFINLFIGSAVTKWSIMASVFVPMFMLVGTKPELTQLAYRIGDSSTNIISPLMPFFGVVLTLAKQFDKKIGLGTIISIMIPYSILLLLVWTIFFALWVFVGIPIGV